MKATEAVRRLALSAPMPVERPVALPDRIIAAAKTVAASGIARRNRSFS